MISYKLIKPKIDNNQYKFLTLPNKLDVLLIYDKDTDISASGMTIQAGFYDDPIDTQGLAHFLEHMLFMGTDKHNEENYFHKFINDAGGMANAHTMEESTTFYFQVLNNYFDEAIDIFSSFFIHPLLSKNAIDREIKAVNSEHKKNLTFDTARVSSILKEFVDNKHPFYNFGCGTTETLSKPNIRDALFDLYNKYYSANLMKLVILSNNTIEYMETKLLHNFYEIQNKNVSRPIIHGFPFTNKNINKKSLCMNLIKSIPVTDNQYLTILWQIPNMKKFYKYKPLEYITHLFGHEAEGSMYHVLKKKELCTSLHAGIFEEDSSFHMFSLSLELTDKGFTYIPYIFDCIYAYIKLIKKNGIQKWLYDEIKMIDIINFDYSLPGEKIDYVSDLSMNMMQYPPEDILAGPYKLNDFDNTFEDLIKKCLSYIKKKNSIVNISSKLYEKHAHKVDKWYNAKYDNYLNPSSFGKEFKNKKLDLDIYLPVKNIFIPKNLELFNNINEINNQYPIKHKNNYELWYLKDNKFNIPQITTSLILYTNKLYESPKNFVLIELYFRLIEHHLTSTMYYANLCSSGFDILIKQNYIIITFYGYSDTILNIIKIFIDTLLNIKINKKEFNFIKYEFKNDLLNFIYRPAFILANDYFKERLYKINYTNQELLDSVHHITINNIDTPKQWFNNNCFIKSFVYGNINEKIVSDIGKQFEIFNCNNKKQMIKENQIILLENGDQHLYLKKNLNKTDENYVILLYFEIDNIIKNVTKDWQYNILCLLLIETHVKEKFFSQLRTIEQSGYIVRSQIQTFQNKQGYLLGLSFLIQSPEIDPIKLRKRIRKFIKSMYDELLKITDDKFNQYKQIKKTLINKKFLSQSDEFIFYNSEIISGEYLFDVKDRLSEFIDKITKKQVIQFYEKYFINKNTRKIRILEMYKDTSINKKN